MQYPKTVQGLFLSGFARIRSESQGRARDRRASELRMQDPLGLGAAAVGAGVQGLRHTYPARAQDAHKKCVRPGFAGLVHQANQRGEMHLSGIGFGAAKTAGKVPVVHAFGQGGTALARHVLAHFMFAGVQKAVAVAAFNVKLE